MKINNNKNYIFFLIKSKLNFKNAIMRENLN